MSEATLQERLVYRGIEAINDCVTKLPMAEAHEAIGLLRAHLEERALQTRMEHTISQGIQTLGAKTKAVYEEEMFKAPDFADLLGVPP